MNERNLDLSSLSAEEFMRVQSGWNDFLLKKGPSYFGYVDKKTLKQLNRLFGYCDRASWVSGAIVGGVAVALYLGHKKKKSEELNSKKED